RAAFDATLNFLSRSRTAGSEPATYLLDEFLELRTFESFPGLRHVLQDCIEGLAASGNRFVLTSRYTVRSLRLLRDRSARFEVIHMPPLTAEDTLDMLGVATGHQGDHRRTRRHARPGPIRRTRGRPDRRARGAARARRPAVAPVQLLLRAAAAPRARLRRAQGDSRNPWRGGRAHADGNLAAAAAHAGFDEGLSLLARGRGSRH